MPVFLCYIGLIELKRWNKTLMRRKQNLIIFNNYIAINKLDVIKIFPLDSNHKELCDIVPHRIVFLDNKLGKLSSRISKYIDPGWFWFKSPIDESDVALSQLSYKEGSCKNSELLSKNIINIPSHFSNRFFILMLKLCFGGFKS